MVEYAHAFREGTYRRRTALAASARRRGCVPLPRSASRGLACNGIRRAAVTTSAIDAVSAVAHRAADASDAPLAGRTAYRAVSYYSYRYL